MKIPQTSLAQALKDQGVINDKEMAEALRLQKERSFRLDVALGVLGIVEPEETINCLAKNYGYDVINPSAISILDDVVLSLPKDVAKKYHVFPIKRQNGILTVAISDPLDISTMEDLRFKLDTSVECVLATSRDIESAIKKYYEGETEELQINEDDICFEGLFEETNGTVIESAKKFGRNIEVEKEVEGPIIKLVSYIINEAAKRRASDIHIEPLSNRIRIRFRIDGVCQEIHSITKSALDAMISRIKILSKMDITEKRKPQDGRITFDINDKPLDIRVNIIPTSCGESVVMRLLTKESSLMKLKSMGFAEHDYNNIIRMLKKPNGIILVTGPTGSGKSTTLYAALNEVNSIDKKIITVEDPIEYTLPGANQCEVKESIGLTFPSVLRTILRQDPNIVVVGEIRDVETAEIAVAAALTGHLVISTLHTNDAPATVTRLTDMGVNPFLISSAIQAILAQRLVRVICPKCKETCKVNQEVLDLLGMDMKDFDGVEVYHGKGCDDCNRTGYSGRRGIYEVMCSNAELRDAIYKKAGRIELRKIARANGMTTLMEDGLRLVREQITTLEEVARVSVK